MSDARPAKEDFMGWFCYLHNYRFRLVWEGLGLQDWNFPVEHRHALQQLFLAYLLSRLDHDRYFSEERIQILKTDAGRAMELGLKPELDDRHRREYFNQLSLIVGYFGERGPRPKRFPRTPEVRKIECIEIVMLFIAENIWPSNKQLVERSKRLGFRYTKKDFSELADEEDGAGFRPHLSSSR